MTVRLDQQFRFIFEIDKLKSILRRTHITGPERRQENDAEHSWHIAMMASVLAEYAPAAVDLSRVIPMLLVHDVVEIDAGDANAYDTDGHAKTEERERRAADRLFGLLPADQASEFRGLWDEYEAAVTPVARYANAIDRLQPLLLNARTEGGSWIGNHVTRSQVLARMEPFRADLPELWPIVLSIVDNACARGWILPAAHPSSSSATPAAFCTSPATSQGQISFSHSFSTEMPEASPNNGAD